jgi:hypothetical protein
MISRRQLDVAEHVKTHANDGLCSFRCEALAPKMSRYVVTHLPALPVIVGSQTENPDQIVCLSPNNGPCWLVGDDAIHEEPKMLWRIGVGDSGEPSRYTPVTGNGDD